MRVLSWNLYHGRDFPPDATLFTLRSRLLRVTERNATHLQVNRPLLDEFARWIGEREWDVAMLQEAPPLWFRHIGARARANGVRVLSSRNVVPPLQRLAANLNPDLIASWREARTSCSCALPAGSSSTGSSRSRSGPSSAA